MPPPSATRHSNGVPARTGARSNPSNRMSSRCRKSAGSRGPPGQWGQSRIRSGLWQGTVYRDAALADGRSARLRLGVSVLVDGRRISWIRPAGEEGRSRIGVRWSMPAARRSCPGWWTGTAI